MGAAQGLWPVRNSLPSVFANLSRFREECEKSTRTALSAAAFKGAYQRGQAMDIAAAIAFALGEELTETPSKTGMTTGWTKRELQVAHLVAQGLSNKQIATKLFISPRTAQGHVEHILTKLGFTSRTQIAAWIVDEINQTSSRP